MRGKENPETLRDGNSGITPAYAGKRYTYLIQMLCDRDHPRVCGEKTPCFSTWLTRLGSPPRMRGKD